ncbi:hypothetical protein V2J09_002161 [Rumex salicifolius]
MLGESPELGPIPNLQAPKKEKAPPPSSKPAKSGGGKQKKKAKCRSLAINEYAFAALMAIWRMVMQKWSKGKQKEKVNNMVVLDQATYDKIFVEASKYKLTTPSVLSDRMRVNGSVARRMIKELETKGLIRMVSHHSSQQIYTRATNTN